jgi:gas vesicle protein
MKKLLKLLLGAGLFVLEQSDRGTNMRDRAGRKIDDLRDVAQQKYDEAADRVARASRALRGEDSQAVGNALLLAAGIGVGISVGLLLAPASGRETRTALVESVQKLRNKSASRHSLRRLALPLLPVSWSPPVQKVTGARNKRILETPTILLRPRSA